LSGSITFKLLDDLSGKTLVSASSLCKEIAEVKGINKVAKSALVGDLIAKKAQKQVISKVVFDRNGYLYHGRVKALADAAREGGLKF